MLYAKVTRALIILSVAVGLEYSAWHSPTVPRAQWNLWVYGNIFLLLVMPLLLGYVLLSDPPAEFGVAIGDWKYGIKAGLLLFVASIPVIVIGSRLPDVQQYYRTLYLPTVLTTNDLLILESTTALYLLAWEFFFRGFLLFGLKPALGTSAIFVQTVLFALGHWGKPPVEVAVSLIAGIALGLACWKAGAFWPAFITHSLSHMSFNYLVLRQ